MAARHETLLRLFDEKGFTGWVQTNEWGKTSKAHFLQMRKEGLVNYMGGDQSYFKKLSGLNPYGPDKNAYFYTITIKGVNKLIELYADNEDLAIGYRNMVKKALTDQNFKDQLEYRS